MDDQQIIAMYRERDEHAIEETAAKYGRLCLTVATNLLASTEDANECVNDTWLHTWNAIPPRRPNKLAAFLGKITRNLALNRYEKTSALKRGGGQVPLALDELAECIPDPNTVERQLDDKLLADLLNVFLSGLTPETRKIFLRRYWNLSSVKEIALEYGISESKVKMSLMRTRGKLRSFLEKEGIAL